MQQSLGKIKEQDTHVSLGESYLIHRYSILDKGLDLIPSIQVHTYVALVSSTSASRSQLNAIN